MKNPLTKRLVGMGLLLFAILGTGTLGFTLIEGMSPVDALYFSVVTVATVGYGDIHPVTPAGRLLAVGIILTGVGTFLYVVANGTELLMERRQEEERRNRLNMVVEVFFSEIGYDVLRYFASADTDCGATRAALDVRADWEPEKYVKVAGSLDSLCMKVDSARLDKEGLRDFLTSKNDLLLRLLENPNLVEHEAFTDLLRALFHVKAELSERKDFGGLPDTDLRHLSGDAERVYKPLVKAWLGHLSYLKANYPYLYSLAVRTNPFRPDADAVVV